QHPPVAAPGSLCGRVPAPTAARRAPGLMATQSEPHVERATSGLLGITARMVGWKIVSSAALAAVALLTARQLGPTGRGVLVLLLLVLLGAPLAAACQLNADLNAFGYTTLATAVDAAGSLSQLVLIGFLVAGGSRSVALYVAALVAGNGLQAVLGVVGLQRFG